MQLDNELRDKIGQADKEGKPYKILLEEFYKPTEEVQLLIWDVYTKYIQWKALKEQTYKQFNSQTCLDYWQDARQKFWGYLPVSYDNDTPQFFFPETRNQIIAILSKIAALRMKPSFDGVKGFDIVTASILKSFFEVWRRGSNRKISNFWQFLYNVINGTVVVFTGYKSRLRDVKNVTMYDPATGETEWKDEKLDESDVEDVICYLEDIFIPKLWEPDLQEQDELIWRTLMKWADFKNAFKGYSMAKYVMPGSQFSDSSIFADFLSYDVRGADFVEVIKYYNKPKDQYAIVANGVLLNPIVDAETKEEVPSPLPWNHKQLPFSKTIFEPIDATFFYGMPLAQKVKSPQEALNRMWELLLEREIRSVSAPIITNDPSIELGLEFKPGRIYQVQAPVDQYRELQMQGASSSYWNALTTLDGVIVKTGSGGAGTVPLPTRQPTSATQNAQESEQRKEASGLYFLFYQDLLEQKCWLTIKNMIQFYTATKTEEILGNRKFKKILTLTEEKLFGGGLGNRELRITDQPASAEELKKESYLRSILKKERVEIIEASPKALQKINFDVKISFEVENSPETERALFIDLIVTLKNLFGQTGMLSDKKMFYRTIEKFNESIGDFVDEKIIMDYESERFGVTPPGANTQPGAAGAPPGAGGPPGLNAPAPGGPGGPVPPATQNINQAMRGQMYGGQARTMPPAAPMMPGKF